MAGTAQEETPKLKSDFVTFWPPAGDTFLIHMIKIIRANAKWDGFTQFKPTKCP